MVYILNNPPQNKASYRLLFSGGQCLCALSISSTNSEFSFLGENTMQLLYRLWHDDQGQDIAEYAVMLAVILVIVVGTVRLIGSNANNVFSNVASSIQ
jgi:Flp pilus assembly pilin Flp